MSDHINDTRLVNILREFGKDELKKLDQFIKSPFFNTNPKVEVLYALLRSKAPDFKTRMTKVFVINKVFAKKYKKYNEISTKDRKGLNDILSKTTKLVENFLAVTRFLGNEAYKSKLLNDSFLEKRLMDEVTGLLNKSEEILNQVPYKDKRYYLDKFLISECRLTYNVIKKNRAQDVGMQELIYDYHKSFYTNILPIYCSAINRERIINVNYHYPLLDSLLEHLQEIKGQEEPMLLIYFHVLKIFREKEEDFHFEQLKKCMSKYHDLFPAYELRRIYSLMANHCRFMVRKGRLEFNQELYELYEKSLKTSIWHEGAYFRKSVFFLIVKTALDAGKLKWAATFIERYKDELNQDAKESLIPLCIAYIKFYSEEYGETREQLRAVIKHEDFAFNLYYRLLEIQIAYEEIEGFENPERERKFLKDKIEALRFFLDRKKNNEDRPMSEKILSSFKCFHKHAKRLSDLKTDTPLHMVSPAKVQKTLDAIKAEYLLEERAWLTEKAEELLARVKKQSGKK